MPEYQEEWTPHPRLPGYWCVGSELISNDEAQDKWAQEHDPGMLLMLLEAGKADASSQKLVAEIISACADRPLPTRKVDCRARDRRIARLLVRYAQWGFRPGRAQAMVADACHVSEAKVRKVAANKELMLNAAVDLLFEQAERMPKRAAVRAMAPMPMLISAAGKRLLPVEGLDAAIAALRRGGESKAA